eukprot:scaffold15034_cov138-Isochrysis_galbana.AAC.1
MGKAKGKAKAQQVAAPASAADAAAATAVRSSPRGSGQRPAATGIPRRRRGCRAVSVRTDEVLGDGDAQDCRGGGHA